jgi:hypothetical protein
MNDDQQPYSGRAAWRLGAQALAAILLVMIGVTIVAAGGTLSGGTLAVAGAWWAWRCSKAL